MNANDIMKALRIVESIQRDLRDGFTVEEIAEDTNMTKDEINEIRHKYLSMTVLANN